MESDEVAAVLVGLILLAVVGVVGYMVYADCRAWGGPFRCTYEAVSFIVSFF